LSNFELYFPSELEKIRRGKEEKPLEMITSAVHNLIATIELGPQVNGSKQINGALI
jgi:hypothetical protein